MVVSKQKGKYAGVYYREHATRKNGIRKDKYFIIRYIGADGKRHDEGFGWETEGYTELKAFQELCVIKDNIKSGKGHTSLKEKQELAIAEKRARELEEKANIKMTIGEFYKEVYSTNNIDRRKESAFRNYILPKFCKMSFDEITPLMVLQFRDKYKELAASSRNKLVIFLGHLFKMAIENGYYNGNNPCSKVKQIKKDNARIRYLERDEAELLLEKLKEFEANNMTWMPDYYARHGTSELYEMSLLSLYTGMRFGEICNLKVADINLNKRSITILDPKNSETRIVPLPDRPYEMLKLHLSEIKLSKNEYVFQKRGGGKIEHISKVFFKRVNETHLNDYIDDPRQKIVFHTLRHTFASWLAIAGIDLYTIQKLMGHKDIKMTQKYSHLSPDKFKAAVDVLN